MGFTLADLQKAEESKRKIIASYYEELNRVSAQIEALQNGDERKKAIREGNLQKLKEISATIGELEKDKIIVLEAIERTSKENYYTDADVIEAANESTKGSLLNITKLIQQYEKDAQKLAKDAYDLAMYVQEISNARASCLMYHTKKDNPNSRSIYAQEGLSNMPQLPNGDKIYGLLLDMYPTQAGFIRAITLGDSIPDFVNIERKDA